MVARKKAVTEKTAAASAAAEWRTAVASPAAVTGGTNSAASKAKITAAVARTRTAAPASKAVRSGGSQPIFTMQCLT